jgi:putative acetyltransferase
MSVEYSIRPETSDDLATISDVHEDAFGTSDPVPALVCDLRQIEGAFPFISLVAEEQGGEIIGHVMLSHAWLDAPANLIDVLALSPLGVRSRLQNQGVGTALLPQAIEAADAVGAPLLFLEGHPAYYGVRGFEPATPLGFRAPSLRIPLTAFQVARLSNYSADMTGSLVYRDAFWARDCVGLRKAAEIA